MPGIANLPFQPRVYLVGFMGVGKTTIGKKLARLLQYRFVDLDQLIEQKEKRTIPEIFEQEGEAYFRETESHVLHDTWKENFSVIATGGGTPCYFDNMEAINKNGTSVFLRASNELIFDRIGHFSHKRPLLQGMNDEEIKKFIAQKTAERLPFYMQAQYILDVPVKGFEFLVNKEVTEDI